MWVECEWDDIKDMKYDSPLKFCNGLLIGFIKKDV